jgi:hypothetical protein
VGVPTRPVFVIDMRACYLFLSAVLFPVGAVIAEENQQPEVSLLEPGYHFEITGISEPVEHVFQFRNNTKEILEAEHIKVTPPLLVSNISARVFPGELGMLRFALGDPRPVGEYEGLIEVDFKNPGISSISFEVTGKITPLVEAKPFPAFFVSTGRGQTKEASLQLINHDKEPLEITGIECASMRFSLRLETNHLGEDYTLFLKLSGEGKPGRSADRITLRTTNRKEPVLLIGANTFIHDRVHTFPEDLDFGTMDLAQVKTNAALRETLRQVLMVYQDGGTNFQVIAYADLPFLKVSSQASSTGKQVQVEVELKPEELRPGDFQGHLELTTSDPEFPKMEINVKGQVR